MARSRSHSLLYLTFFLFSCGKELPELNGINKEDWISDRNGCLNKRRTMVEAIREQRDKLLALDELKIVALLGKPDENELAPRNQKFYHYSLTPAADCLLNKDSVSVELVIRFNAMGLAKEVEIQ
jgi:hypothetical protein